MAGVNQNIFYYSGPTRSYASLAGKVSSSRMLNLHQLWLDQPDELAYVLQPFFVHPILNRSILLKHNLRRGEEGRFAMRRLGATKVVLPLDVQDLGLGGQYVIVGQDNFVPLLTSSLDYTGLDLDRDLKMLTILDTIPSLDPFLLYQVSVHYDLNVGRCYFRMNKTDIDKMSGFVMEEIRPLVELSMGGGQQHEEGVERLCKLLIAENVDDPMLAILRQGLRMTPDQFSAAMFSWKALMFYKQRLADIEPDLKKALTAILDIRPSRKLSDHFASYVGRTKLRIRLACAQAWNEANAVISQYERAYASMVRGRKPSQFRELLLDSHHRYVSLGLRVARLEHVAGFWAARSSRVKKPMPLDELCALLIDLDRHLCTDLSLPSAQQLELHRTAVGLDMPEPPDPDAHDGPLWAPLESEVDQPPEDDSEFQYAAFG